MTIDITKELEQAGAVLLDRHFVYTSGKHGSGYINNDPLFTNVSLMSQLCEMLVAPFVGKVDTIVAPATGGIVLSVLATRALVDKGQRVAAVWADKTSDGGFAFERAGFVEQIRNKRVLVVEDLLNTGHSVEKVCRLIEQNQGKLIGVSVIEDRGNATVESLNTPRLETLMSIKMEAQDAKSCALCAAHIPIIEDIGHGAEYKSEHPDYLGGFVKLQ